MELIVIYLVAVVIVGNWARNRGRSFLVWSLMSLILSPLLAVVGLLILPKRTGAAMARPAGALKNLSGRIDTWSSNPENQAKVQAWATRMGSKLDAWSANLAAKTAARKARKEMADA